MIIRLENFLKMSWRRLQNVSKTSWRRLEDILKMFLQDVLKTSWKRLEDILARRLEDILKTSWKRLEGVLKTYGQGVLKTSSEDEDEDFFKTSSSRRMFSGMRHNSYVLFHLNLYMLWTEKPIKVEIFRLSTARMKIK